MDTPRSAASPTCRCALPARMDCASKPWAKTFLSSCFCLPSCHSNEKSLTDTESHVDQSDLEPTTMTLNSWSSRFYHFYLILSKCPNSVTYKPQGSPKRLWQISHVHISHVNVTCHPISSPGSEKWVRKLISLRPLCFTEFQRGPHLSSFVKEPKKKKEKLKGLVKGPWGESICHTHTITSS